MEFGDLLEKAGIEQSTCLVLRHRPQSLELRRQLPWLAAERPDVFNCYQQTQSPRCEGQMRRAKHVASFIGHEPGKAVFVGLYRMHSFRELNHMQFLAIPAVVEERRISGVSSVPEKRLITWFDLEIMDFYAEWKGRLIIRWPPPEISWNRWAVSNQFEIDAIYGESLFAQDIPDWRDLVLTWDDLRAIPSAWRDALSHWRGIYFILDSKSGRGYVGSAYGADNLLGRWLNYAKTGHGGNRWLKECEPQNLKFSILERMSPDTPPEEIIPRESSWKVRLHTREFGLNGN
ncbi:MAG: GIY-YIG nuclease family protein [Planctomycetaceae bacterium]